jgi:pyridoxal phosphate enzyme (YggS family)
MPTQEICVTDLRIRLNSVLGRIAAAADRTGRDPTQVRLVAVTKNQPLPLIAAAYELGLRHFGENRVEEAAGKVTDLPPDIVWHMIGHIQSRKAKQVIPLFRFVHSVDSLRLALRLDRLVSRRPEPLPVLLEINVSGENAKYGFPADHWSEDRAQRQSLLTCVQQIAALPHLKVEGLMTIAPVVAEAEQARPFFAQLRKLRAELSSLFPESAWNHLSMGMTDDFEVAVEEGATIVRIGRAIFAPEQPEAGWQQPGTDPGPP